MRTLGLSVNKANAKINVLQSLVKYFYFDVNQM